MAGRSARAPGVAEAIGDLHDALRGLAEAAYKLLLQHVLDLLRGQRHRDQAIAKWLYGERFTVGHVVRVAGCREPGGAHAASVHERDDGATVLRRCGCAELGVCYEVASGYLAVGIGHI